MILVQVLKSVTCANVLRVALQTQLEAHYRGGIFSSTFVLCQESCASAGAGFQASVICTGPGYSPAARRCTGPREPPRRGLADR